MHELIRWFRIYAWSLAALYALAIVFVMNIFGNFRADLKPTAFGPDRSIVAGQAGFMATYFYVIAGFLAVAAIACAICALLPRSKALWNAGVVLQVIGFTGGITIIPSIILFIHWIRPEFRYYCKGPSGR